MVLRKRRGLDIEKIIIFQLYVRLVRYVDIYIYIYISLWHLLMAVSKNLKIEREIC